jgi:hypothetical protein
MAIAVNVHRLAYTDCQETGFFGWQVWKSAENGGFKYLVPKRGLEPPHPCEYMDLNHARLPIPPLRHGMQSGLNQIGSKIEFRKSSALCQGSAALETRRRP